jgi:hypothetical protein
VSTVLSADADFFPVQATAASSAAAAIARALT